MALYTVRIILITNIISSCTRVIILYKIYKYSINTHQTWCFTEHLDKPVLSHSAYKLCDNEN